jgi:nucleoside-diphosphate-sugar epimerase
MSAPTPSLPKGSLILVTGATGFLASHTVKQLLQRGYTVRGTVRSLEAAKWLTTTDFFPEETGSSSSSSSGVSASLQLVEVPDLATPHAFDDAVRGVAGIVHIATVGTFDPDPNNVVPQTVAGVTGILTAAEKEPTVKEFVYTSSIVTSTFATEGNYTHVTEDTWNDAVMDVAWAPPPYNNTPGRGMAVYVASKVAAEREVWRFVRERRRDLGFNVNCICPSGILGRPLHKKHAEGVAFWVKYMWDGIRAPLEPYPACKQQQHASPFSPFFVATTTSPPHHLAFFVTKVSI